MRTRLSAVLILAVFVAALFFVFNSKAATVVNVHSGESLQTAINVAVASGVDTVIVLDAGATYSEIVLPPKPVISNITIQTSAVGQLPEGVRVGPSQSSLFAKIQTTTPATPAIQTLPGANGYSFIGIEVSTLQASQVVYDLVKFGSSGTEQDSIDEVPTGLVFDRGYIHGWPTQDVQRGVALNSGKTDIINSYISDIHMVGIEAQGIAGWNGPGPYQIVNNFISGASQNILFGGADPDIAGLIPSDITISRNYLFKPLTWKTTDPTYLGQHWTVKNLLELKNAKNVFIDGNIMENNWVDGQDGTAVLFTVRNQECTAPWATIQNVTFNNNTLSNADGGALNFLGMDNEVTAAFGKCNPASTSVRGSGVAVYNNLFYNIRGPFLLMNGFYDVSLERNTHLQRYNTMTFYGEQSLGFIYRNNVTVEEPYGVVGDGISGGTVALEYYAPGYVFTGNVIAHPYATNPLGNEYPASIEFSSDYRTSYVGKGADIDVLNAVQSGVVSTPTPTPSLTPTPTPTPTATPTPTPTPVPEPRMCVRTNPKGKCVKYQ